MIKNSEKWGAVMLLNFLNLVLKKYGKWFLNMCGTLHRVMHVVMASFNTSMGQMTEMSQWPKCLSEKKQV